MDIFSAIFNLFFAIEFFCGGDLTTEFRKNKHPVEKSSYTVFEKVFIFYSTMYCIHVCPGVVYSLRTMSMSTIRVFSSRFIIIPPPNYQSFATWLKNCWLIQYRSSSNRRHEWFWGLVECRYLNTSVVAKLF